MTAALTATLAAIASGKSDFAEVCFLVAFILATILTVVAVVRSNVEAALLPAAVAFIAVGFVVLF